MEIVLSRATADLDIEASKFSPAEIATIPEYSLHRTEDIFKVPAKQGWIVFDNKNGLGNTPNGRNILYRGCVAIMSIATLLDCLPDMRSREKESFEMLDYIKQGYGIASPFIDIEIDPYVDKESGVARFVGHEGRARIWAMSKLGVKEIPVQLQFVGYRAREVTDKEEFKYWLNQGCKLQRSSRIVKNLFKELQFG